jgi:preprotein translocase subunit SecG
MNASIAVFSIVAALAVLGIVVVMVAVTILLQQQPQQAEAAGCANGSHAFFQSKGNCLHP